MPKKSNTEEFIENAKIIHGNKFDYSKVNYNGNKTKVEIICERHGSFLIRPNDHCAQKQGCPICGGTKKLSLEIFINKCKDKHGNKYDYSLIKEYKNNLQNVEIICPKHGIFCQTTKAHYSGNGCPKCKTSKLENEVEIILNEIGVDFIQNFKHPLLDHSNYSKQHLDFFLNEFNIAIECNGRQHYQPVEKFGGLEAFKKILKLDNQKKQICLKHNIILLEYSFFFKKNDKINFLKHLKHLINETINNKKFKINNN